MRSSSFCKVESSALMGHGGTQRGAVDVHLSPTQRRSPQSSLPHGRPRLGDISNETKRGHFSCNSTCQPQANFSIQLQHLPHGVWWTAQASNPAAVAEPAIMEMGRTKAFAPT